MASISEVLLLFKGDAAGAIRAARETGAAISETNEKSKGFGATLGGLGKMAGVALATAAIGGLTVAVAEGVKAYSEYQDANVQLQQALKDTGQALPKDQLEAFDSSMRHLGITDTTAEDSLRKLIQAQIPAGKAMQDMGVIADFAAARHVSLSDATDMLAKGANGRLNPALKEMGVHLEKGEKGAKAFDSIIQQLGPHVAGAAAAHANTFSGAMDKLKASFDHVAVSIGEKVAPVLEKVANWFGDHSEQIGGFVSGVLDALGQAFQWIATNVIPPLVQAFQEVSKWVQDNKPTLQKLADFISKDLALAFKSAVVMWKIAIEIAITVIGVLVKVVQAIAAAIQPTVDFFKKAWESIKGAVTSAVDGIRNAIGAAFNWIKTTFPGLIDFIKEAVAVLVLLFDIAFNTVVGLVKTAFDVISAIVGAAFGIIKGLVEMGWGIIEAVFSAVLGPIKAIVAGAFNYVKNTVSTILNVIKDVINIFLDVFTGKWGGAWNSAKQLFVDIWNGIVSFFTNIVGTVMGIVTGFIGGLKGIWNGLVDFFKGLGDFIAGLVKSPINIVVGIVNGVIDFIDGIKFQVPDWVPGIGGKGWGGVGIGHIPSLAEGSGFNTVPGGMVARIFDNPRGERIQTRDDYEREQAASRGGDIIHIHNPPSEFAAARMISTKHWLMRISNRGIGNPGLLPMEAS